MRIAFILLAVVVCIVLVKAQPELPLAVSNLAVITTDNAASLEKIRLDDQDVKQIAVSPDGTRIAVASQYRDYDYNIRVYDSRFENEIIAIQGRMDFFREMEWSPDGGRIAVISGRRTGGGVEERSVKIYTVDAASNQGRYMAGNSDVWYTDYVYPEDQPENKVAVAWSTTGDVIAVAFHNRLVIFSVMEEAALFSSEVIGIEHVEWSANGSMIFTDTDDGRTQVWGVPSDVESAN